jgi:hypothetical protein
MVSFWVAPYDIQDLVHQAGALEKAVRYQLSALSEYGMDADLSRSRGFNNPPLAALKSLPLDTPLLAAG